MLPIQLPTVGFLVAALVCVPLVIPQVPRADHDHSYSALAGREFGGKDLGGANFGYSVLTDARFQNSNLKEASFDYGAAAGAHFEGADLRGASLRYSVLSDATFQGADLRGAVFNYSILSAADFLGADLRGAKFQCAVLPEKHRFDATTLYDETTEFPEGFNPVEKGLKFVPINREKNAADELEAALDNLRRVAAKYSDVKTVQPVLKVLKQLEKPDQNK
jgi:hypothetical protein